MARMDKMDIIDVMDVKGHRRLEFVYDKPLHSHYKEGKNDIISVSKVEIGYQDNISLSYFRDGTLLVSRLRYHPVTTMMTVHLARSTEEGKRRAVAYVLKAMSEVLQDEDVNEELDI